MYIGIDLGTSGVKVIAITAAGNLVATASMPLTVQRPQPLWSEQDPEQWWLATEKALQELAKTVTLSEVKGIGLSGQMHGATLLDKQGRVLRPAILWNDGRCVKQCRELERLVPESRMLTGNLMMPGFTAPKLKWLAEHEPEIFAQIDKVLLPKDYLRWRLTGEFATDMSDAAGTMWLNVRHRDWEPELLAACQLTTAQMPQLYEGCDITGYLRPELAERWGMKTVPVVAGGGDNAAGAVGAGISEPGQAMLSLGTSGVYFAVSDGFRSNPECAVHSFCHALPDSWHLMSVVLSAASCLDWAVKLTGLADVPALLAAAEAAEAAPSAPPLLFLPYLSGERTPHNNAYACGSFFGLTHQHDRGALALAVLRGVGFALAEGMDVLHDTGTHPHEITLIGGGARSAYWRQMLADITGQPLNYRTGGEVGAALGAAKLARVACETGSTRAEMFPLLPLQQLHQPIAEHHEYYRLQRQQFAQLYRQLLPLMNEEWPQQPY